MKLNLALSTFLISSSFILGGCGSSDSSASDTANDTPSIERGSNFENAIKKVDSLNMETDSLTSVLTEIKATLGTSYSDEIALASIIDIVEILNSDSLNNLLQQDSGMTNLDMFSGETDYIINMASTATLSGGTDILHELAVKLIGSVDNIAIIFSDKDKTISYGDINITQNDTLMIQAQASVAAAQLEFIASYSYGDISFFQVQEKTINGVSYEYFNYQIDPLELISQDDFFKMQNTSRLTDARQYLKDGLTLYSSYEIDVDDSNPQETENKIEAMRLLAALNGDGKYMDIDNPDDGIDVNKLYSSSDYLDREDFIFSNSYVIDEEEATLNIDKSIVNGAPFSLSLNIELDFNMLPADSFNDVIFISE